MANWEYVRNGKKHRFQTSGERGSTTRIHENISIKNEHYFDKNFNYLSKDFFDNNDVRKNIDILNDLNKKLEEENLEEEKKRFFRVALIFGIVCPVSWVLYFPLKWAMFGKIKK